MLYYHFGSKRGLYLEVAARHVPRRRRARPRDCRRPRHRRARSSTPGSPRSSRRRPPAPGSRPSCCASSPPARRTSTPTRSRMMNAVFARRARHHRPGPARGRVPRRRPAADAPHDHAAHPDLLRAPARARRNEARPRASPRRASSTSSSATCRPRAAACSGRTHDDHATRPRLRSSLAVLAGRGARRQPPDNALRVSGHVEATEVQVAAEVGGRILELRVGRRRPRQSPATWSRRSTRATPSCRFSALRAERAAAEAQLRLLGPARAPRTSARPRRRSTPPRPRSPRSRPS